MKRTSKDNTIATNIRKGIRFCLFGFFVIDDVWESIEKPNALPEYPKLLP